MVEMESVEKMVGRPFRSEGHKSVRSFNDLPLELLGEVRELARKSRAAAAVYLRHYVEHWDGYDDFIDDVLIAEKSAEDWGVRDVIVYPSSQLSLLLRQELSGVLVSLSAFAGERCRVVPTLRTWWEYPGYGGAPGVVVADSPYWFEVGKNLSFSAFEGERLEPIKEGFESALCCWVASRVARDCQRFESSEIDSLKKISVKLGVSEETMSVDAKSAIRNLLGSGWPQRRPQLDSARPGCMVNELGLPPGFTADT